MTVKPSSVKAILGVEIFLVTLAWAFYGFFLSSQPDTELTRKILLTASAFTVLLIPIVIAVRKQNALVLRVCLLLNIVASVPVGAYISIALSLVALTLSFAGGAKAYFGGWTNAGSEPAG